MRPSQGRPAFVAYALIPILLAACSSSSSGDSGREARYAAAMKAYQESAANRSSEVAGTITAAYVKQLGSAPPDDAFFQQFKTEITALTEFVCGQIKELQQIAGSGEARAQRLDDVRVSSEETVRDAFVSALLRNVMSSAPDQREQLLNTLGVKSVRPDGTELRGKAALEDVGLVSSQGELDIPARGTDQYTRYERWLTDQARGFAGINLKLMGRARGDIEGCASST